LAGVSALRNILELKKIAFASIGDFKDDWMTEKDFKKLHPDVLSALSEIQYIKEGKKKIVKFKVHDKQRAIEGLNKMLGFDAPEKIDIHQTGGLLNVDVSDRSTKDLIKIVKEAKKK